MGPRFGRSVWMTGLAALVSAVVVAAPASSAGAAEVASAPQNVAAVFSSTGSGPQVTVTWSPPADTGDSPISQYVVRANSQPHTPWAGGWIVVDAGATSVTFTHDPASFGTCPDGTAISDERSSPTSASYSLCEYEDYVFSVAAVNGAGWSPSGISGVVNIPGPAAPLDAPQVFTDDDPAPVADPRFDLVGLSVDYVDDQITVAARTQSPEDPRLATSIFATEAAHLFFRFGGADVSALLYQHENTNAGPFGIPGESIIARFEFRDFCGLPVWPGEFVGGAYQVTFPAACLGTPPWLRIGAEISGAGGGDSIEMSPPVLRRVSPQPPQPPQPPPGFVGVGPVRLLDTRAGNRPDGGDVVVLPVGTVAGVPADAVAAVLNVTATDPAGAGFVTVWPCDQPRPTTAGLYVGAGDTVGTAVVARLASNGTVCLFTNAGTHLVADLFGYFPPGTSYVPVVPGRLIDTRLATVKPGAGAVVRVQVAGAGGVPSDAAAVVLTVTATEASAAGFVTVWPCDRPRPFTSNVYVGAGATIANLVVSELAADGSVCAFTNAGTHVVADLNGFHRTATTYVPLTAERLVDTRTGAKPGPGGVVAVQVAGEAGVPTGARVAVLNVTATDVTGAGFVTVWPCDQPRPATSSLYVQAGATIGNLVVTRLAADGTACMYTNAGTHLVADVNGHHPA